MRIVRFLVIGGLSTVVTIGSFNLLVHVGTQPALGSRPLTAYVIALGAGLVVNYFGNRLWVFGSQVNRSRTMHLIAFAITNAVAFVIPMICLAVSRYGLGLSSVAADNLSANGIGLVLATLARWLGYRHFVFGGQKVRTSGDEVP